MKEVYTTTQAARLLGCSANHVRNILDRGALVCWLIPRKAPDGPRHRRIERSELIRYIKANGLPMPAELR